MRFQNAYKLIRLTKQSLSYLWSSCLNITFLPCEISEANVVARVGRVVVEKILRYVDILQASVVEVALERTPQRTRPVQLLVLVMVDVMMVVVEALGLAATCEVHPAVLHRLVVATGYDIHVLPNNNTLDGAAFRSSSTVGSSNTRYDTWKHWGKLVFRRAELRNPCSRINSQYRKWVRASCSLSQRYRRVDVDCKEKYRRTFLLPPRCVYI